MAEDNNIIGVDFRVDDPKIMEFLNIWLRAGLTPMMSRAGIDCKMKATGNVFSIEIHRSPAS